MAKSLGHTLVTVSVTEYEEYLGSSATFAAYGPLKVRRLMVHHYISSRDPPPLTPWGPPALATSGKGRGVCVLFVASLLPIAPCSDPGFAEFAPAVSATGTSKW